MAFPRDNMILDPSTGNFYCWEVGKPIQLGAYFSPAQVILNAANCYADRVDHPRRWPCRIPLGPEPKTRRTTS